MNVGSLLLAASLALSPTPDFSQCVNVERPDVVAFGSSLETVKNNLASVCTSIQVREILPITAPLAKQSQTQIDCTGFDYAGKPREAEFVFQDDQLDLVWILFPPEELPFFTRAFIERYGEPSMEIDFGMVFLNEKAAVRSSPSEVVFVSDRQLKAMLQLLKSSKAQ